LAKPRIGFGLAGLKGNDIVGERQIAEGEEDLAAMSIRVFLARLRS
jgi:hypothetical protein